MVVQERAGACLPTWLVTWDLCRLKHRLLGEHTHHMPLMWLLGNLGSSALGCSPGRLCQCPSSGQLQGRISLPRSASLHSGSPLPKCLAASTGVWHRLGQHRASRMPHLDQATLLGPLADFAGVCIEHAPILFAVLLVLSPGIPLSAGQVMSLRTCSRAPRYGRLAAASSPPVQTNPCPFPALLPGPSVWLG